GIRYRNVTRVQTCALPISAADDDQFNHKVRELEAVVPNDISIKDVTVNPGVHWVPQELYNEFVRDTFEVSAAVRWNPGGEQWERSEERRVGRGWSGRPGGE